MQFEDKQVGQLHRQEYKQYYGDGIFNTWTPIFTQYRETTVYKCRAIRTQFPLIPAAAVTIHKCQGSTLRNVVVDMDVSPSPYYAENFEQAKNFLSTCALCCSKPCAINFRITNYKLVT